MHTARRAVFRYASLPSYHLELFSFSFLALRCPGKPSGSGGLGVQATGREKNAVLLLDFHPC